MSSLCPVTLIVGGSASGKSRYAEDCLLESARLRQSDPRLLYIATLRPNHDPENEARIRRHRAQRRGKNFRTFEITRDLADRIGFLPQDSFVLLDCLDNLLANEMFAADNFESGYSVQTVHVEANEQSGKLRVTRQTEIKQKIVLAVEALCRRMSHCVIVSNTIFNDPFDQDWSAGTREFISGLADLQRTIAAWPQTELIRVCAGLPLVIKFAEQRSAVCADLPAVSSEEKM